jgi:hypothetical protein
VDYNPLGVGESEEVMLVDRAQNLDDGAPDDFVFQRVNAEGPPPPVRLRDESSPNRLGPVRPSLQPGEEIAEVFSQVFSVVPPCLAIDASGGVSLEPELRRAQTSELSDLLRPSIIGVCPPPRRRHPGVHAARAAPHGLRGSIPDPHAPLSTRRLRPCGRRRMTRGRRGPPFLHRMARSFTTRRGFDRRTEMA